MVSHTDNSSIIGLPLGSLIQGRYRPIRELGRGPVSVVYLGEDHQQGGRVAIKVLELGASDRARARHDVMAVWELAHDHIVATRACFEVGELFCVVLDHISGPDLGTRVRSNPLSPEESAAVGRGIALGLQAAHRLGILHRHVTPGNILVGPEVQASLADFGSAGYSRPGRQDQREDFLAPEVLAGQAADARADLYGLGLSLYFAITGRLPDRQVPGRPPAAAADGHRPSLVRPTVPVWLDDAIARATAALPADRFNSAGRLAEALTPQSVRSSEPALR